VCATSTLDLSSNRLSGVVPDALSLLLRANGGSLGHVFAGEGLLASLNCLVLPLPQSLASGCVGNTLPDDDNDDDNIHSGDVCAFAPQDVCQ
jgi:hypothetical protein